MPSARIKIPVATCTAITLFMPNGMVIFLFLRRTPIKIPLRIRADPPAK